jgi:hypothetical protein
MNYRKPMPDSKSAQEGMDHYFARSRPGDQSDINDGKPWSEMDIADLKNHVAHGASMDKTATVYAAPARRTRSHSRRRSSD